MQNSLKVMNIILQKIVISHKHKFKSLQKSWHVMSYQTNKQTSETLTTEEFLCQIDLGVILATGKL